MRKLVIGMVVALAVLGACGDDGEDTEAQVDNIIESAGDALDELSEDEFVTVEGERLTITESCVDNSGTYKGQVDGGGLFILRGGGAPQESFVDFQPSADADPLSSQTPEDTVLTQEGALTTGTATVSTEDGANSLEIEFQIQIGEIDETC